MTIALGTQVTLSGATSGLEVNIMDISWSDWSRAVVDTTTNNSTIARDFIPSSLYDPGTLSITAKLDADTATNLPPITAAIEAWTVSVVGAGTETFICNGFVSGKGYSFPHEDANTVNFEIKLTGAVTGTYSS